MLSTYIFNISENSDECRSFSDWAVPTPCPYYWFIILRCYQLLFVMADLKTKGVLENIAPLVAGWNYY